MMPSGSDGTVRGWPADCDAALPASGITQFVSWNRVPHARGTIEVHSATDPAAVSLNNYFKRVIQTWEEICMLVEQEVEIGGLAKVHSDMASIRVGLM
jgi:hypothetical protein